MNRGGREGATPIDPEEADDLVPSWIENREELDAREQANIAAAAGWLFRRRRSPDGLLKIEFLREVHRRMFDATWRWAGEFRQTEKNIGAPPEQIIERLAALLPDVRFWVEQRTYAPDEIAARFHHRLVQIHPFPNGNGRHARLMADALLRGMGHTPFTWGAASLDQAGAARTGYLAALRAADGGDYGPLLRFVRS
jgi:Fic-DOC domain mobile mystery protein B